MADQAPPQGRAPRGFWNDPESEMILLTVMLAKIDRDVISQIDMEGVARIVGEGKLSKPSCRAKLTELVGKGRQRVADSDARLRAGNDRAPPPEDVNNGPRLSGYNQPPAADGNDRPENPVDRKRKIDAPGHFSFPASMRKKRKKRKKRQHESHTVEDIAEYDESGEGSDDSSNKGPPASPDDRLTSEELDSALGDLFSQSSPPDLEKQTNNPVQVKEDLEEHSERTANPALQTKGQTQDSAIEIDDLYDDSTESEDDELPAGISSMKQIESSLAIRGSREPHSAKKSDDKRGPASKEAKYYAPSGKIHRVPVLNRTRSWQAPYTRQISITTTDKEMMNNWGGERDRQPGGKQ